MPSRLITADCPRIDDDGETGEVLRRGADHRRSADVDHLDRFGVGDAGTRDRALERIEVDRHQVEALDAVLGEGRAVRGLGAVGEDAAVDLRMQGLDPTVEYLRETGDFGDPGDRQAGCLEVLLRAAGRDELEAEPGEAASELGEAGLVGDGEESAERGGDGR